MDEEPPNILYHYCSLGSLRSIIENKHLYMTNAIWMDDKTELVWLRKMVQRVLDRYPSDERHILHERFTQIINQREPSHVYCTCFSGNPDSRSQWLEYADDGHGFAVGFDTTAFDLKRSTPKRDIQLQRVRYDEAEQEDIVERILRPLKPSDSKLQEDFALFGCTHNVWWYGAWCKNPAFSNEKEWRLICRDDPGDNIEFREKSDRHLIPFTKFPFEPDKHPIREIWLGPRNQSQRNVDALARLLATSGYDAERIEFKGSDIPLRPEY